jgi:hypothetical protein
MMRVGKLDGLLPDLSLAGDVTRSRNEHYEREAEPNDKNECNEAESREPVGAAMKSLTHRKVVAQGDAASPEDPVNNVKNFTTCQPDHARAKPINSIS